jgi:formate C-acetyltransferase
MNKLYLSDRIKLLNEGFEENYIQSNVEGRRNIYQDVFCCWEHAGSDFRMAKALAEFLEKKEIKLKEYDLFAGHLQFYNYKDSIPVDSLDNFDASTYPRPWFDVHREVSNYFSLEGENLSPKVAEAQRELLNKFTHANDHKMYVHWDNGHVVCSYDRIVSLGLPALMEDVRVQLENKEGSQRENTKAMLTSLEGLKNYILRYAERADELLANTNEPIYRVSLRRIAESCRYITKNKPSCLFDALQLFILTVDAMISENVSGSISIGRFDQFIYPYYKADIEAGRINHQQAAELIDATWLKIASLKQSFQNLTLGGCDENGNFAGNEVTLLCMQAARKIARDQPLLSFRYQPGMPDVFWDEILTLINSGLGFPAIFNDEVIFKAKIDAGVDPKDVWRYAIVGCVEPSIPGDEYSNTEQLRVNWAKILEIMINPKNEGNLRPEKTVTLDSIKSFDELYNWYKSELKYYTQLGMDKCNLLDSTYGKTWPAPFLSALTKDCPIKGQDITRGTLRYSFSSVNGTGMADVVDSLLSIKEIVFNQRRMSFGEFVGIVNSDFAGHEDLRSELLVKPWRFGNDEDASNDMIRDLTDFFVNHVTNTKNVFGKKFQAGLYSVDHHAHLGAKTGPLPSGRRGGVSLANALSPCQGVDINGPTAVMCSATRVDHTRLGNGMVLDLKFTPQFLQKQSHLEKLRQMIIAYFEIGGMEVQFNVVKRETLLAAQKEPQKYRNLIVRVSGFSAYFINLDRVLQNEIIARTEYAHEGKV